MGQPSPTCPRCTFDHSLGVSIFVKKECLCTKPCEKEVEWHKRGLHSKVSTVPARQAIPGPLWWTLWRSVGRERGGARRETRARTGGKQGRVEVGLCLRMLVGEWGLEVDMWVRMERERNGVLLVHVPAFSPGTRLVAGGAPAAALAAPRREKIREPGRVGRLNLNNGKREPGWRLSVRWERDVVD